MLIFVPKMAAGGGEFKFQNIPPPPKRGELCYPLIPPFQKYACAPAINRQFLVKKFLFLFFFIFFIFDFFCFFWLLRKMELQVRKRSNNFYEEAENLLWFFVSTSEHIGNRAPYIRAKKKNLCLKKNKFN